MPHTSSPASHVQLATMCHFFIVTLKVMLLGDDQILQGASKYEIMECTLPSYLR